jgi:hypothetical protein
MAVAGPTGEEQPNDAEDVLDIGSSGPGWLAHLAAPPPERTRRAGWYAGGVAVAAVLVAALVHGGSPPPAPRAAPHDPTHSLRTLASIRELAARRSALADYVRQTSAAGACALVRVGLSPTDRVVHTVATSLPGFRLKDSGRTLDQFTGLCSLIVRETRPGAVLTISVASPGAQPPSRAYTKIETGIESDAAATTKYVRAETPTGWTVLVGATGHQAQLPTAADLVRLAQQAGLLW